MSVTVYSKPSCIQCTATYRALEQKGVEYTVIDLSQDESAYNTVRDLGYMQVPVVVAGDEHWMGFRPDKINGISG